MIETIQAMYIISNWYVRPLSKVELGASTKNIRVYSYERRVLQLSLIFFGLRGSAAGLRFRLLVGFDVLAIGSAVVVRSAATAESSLESTD